MNILLINPPNCGKSIPEERYGIESIKLIFRGEPLALETLAGNLSGHDVTIIDLKVDPDALTAGKLPAKPDLVGLTGVTCEANTVLQIAETMKSAFDVPVIVGGHHASCDPSFFHRPCIDYVVIGLGKRSFRQLVEAVETGDPVQIPGVIDNSRPSAFVPRRYSLADLVDDAAPRYDLVASNRDRYVMSGIGGKTGFVATAFGCTHECLFCCIPSITGGNYLVHKTASVLRDISLLADVPTIRLVDANTFGHVKAAEKLGQALIETGLQKQLVADVRSDTVVNHPNLFALWHRAGLRVAVIGFEEISDEKLTAFNKKNAHRTNLKAIEILRKLGIRIVGDFIISPDYEETDFRRLIEFVDDSGIDIPIPAVLTPIPGTALYRKTVDRITIHDLDYYTFTNAVMPTRMTEKDFYQAYANMLKHFLGRVHARSA
jgi:hopanoid C-3 methylase